MKFLIELDVQDNSTLETALHDAAVIVRCKLRDLAQREEFRYLDGSSVRLVDIGTKAASGPNGGSV